jgi:predicted component of type VI protein secretion system
LQNLSGLGDNVEARELEETIARNIEEILEA